MRVEIFAPCLRALDRIFRFRGSEVSISTLELGAPQPVYDVARIASIADGPGFHGITTFTITNAHTVVGETTQGQQATTPTTAFWSQLGVTQDSHWLWLLEATVRTHPDLVVTEAFLALDQLAFPFAMANHKVLTHMWNAKTGQALAPSGTAKGLFRTTADPRQVNLPRVIPDNTEFVFTSTASGAVESVICQIMVAVLPKGIGPRGMA